MSTTLTLTEWQQQHGLALTSAQARLLQSTFQADVRLETAGRGGEQRWTVRPSSIVGTARADDVEVVVRPKTPVANVLFLLGVGAGREPDHAAQDEVEVATADDLVTAVAGLYARMAERLLLGGVLRGYRAVEDVRHTVRGRVNVAEQLRRRPGRGMPVAVRYDEHDEDVLENRLVLAAARALLRLRPDVRTQQRLRRVVAALDDVTAVAFHAPVPAVRWTHLNARYRPTVELARLVLAGGGVDVDGGARQTVGLTLDMNQVFEDFVCTTLGAALEAHQGRAQAQDTAWTLDEEGSVRLRPDLVWYSATGRPAAVVDAKYKVREGRSTPESDVYQMHAYCTALGLLVGHLVYAEAGGRAAVTVRNGGPAIRVHSIDLSVRPPLLLAATRRLADVVRTMAPAASAVRG